MTKRVYNKWSAEETSKALAMRAGGLTFVEIGAKLGRSDKAVQSLIKKATGGFAKLGRKCSTCASAIPDANKSGLCRPCNTRAQNADPEFTAKRLTALLECPYLQPGAPTRREAARKATVTRMANPAYVERLRVHMRDVMQPASLKPEARAKIDRKAMGDKLREHYLGWCPLEYRKEYARLVRGKGLPAREARKIIQDVIERAKPKPVVLSPFERQERALRNGAQLQDNRPVTIHSVTANEVRAKIG